MREETSLCEVCCNVADRTGRCDTCSDPRRDATMICVVEDPRDVVAVERSGAFRGTYHVLHGALNPLEGVGADQLHVAELKSRLADGGIAEVILCMNPNVEGDATATYLTKVLASFGVAITRPASGLPVGGDLEFADDATLVPRARRPSARRVLAHLVSAAARGTPTAPRLDGGRRAGRAGARRPPRGGRTTG